MVTHRTPYEHKVHSHTRSGVKVSEYTRGKGKQIVEFKRGKDQVIKRRVTSFLKEKTNMPSMFTVIINGEKTSSVNADTFGEAMQIGLDGAVYPKSVKVRR